MKWGVLGTRITLFPGPAPATHLPSANDLYGKVWSAAPEAFQQPPNALAPGVAQGQRGGITVGCAVHPSRVDFNLQPIPPDFNGPVRLAVIEDTETLRQHMDLVVAYVGREGISDSVLRVGTFLQMVVLARDIPEANRIVLGTIPERYRPQLSAEEDFMFQVNPIEPSAAVEGVRMNLVTKWATNRFQVISVGLPFNVAAPRSGDFIGATITFDNNNVPAATPLSQNQQSSLLREGIASCSRQLKEFGIELEGF